MFANASRTILAVTLAGALSTGPAFAFPQNGQAQFNPHAQPHLNPNALKPVGVKQYGNLGLNKPNLPPVGKPLQGGPAKVPGYGGGYGYGPGHHGPNGWAMAGAGLGVGLAAGAVGAAIAHDGDDEECRIVRQRVIDEDGNMYIRRVTRCD